MSEPTPPESLFANRLRQLGGWLIEHDPLWRERPFAGLPLFWEEDFPDVSRALRALPNETIERFEPTPRDLPDMPAAYRWGASAHRRRRPEMVCCWPGRGRDDHDEGGAPSPETRRNLL